MQANDLSHPSSDIPPKRWTKNSRASYIVFILIIINMGVASVLANFIEPEMSASTSTEVKNQSTTLENTPLVEVASNVSERTIDEDIPVITTYTVKNGDTLSGIAETFGISINTIRWANDLKPTATIAGGDELVILPVTGIEYTVKKGDTLSGVATKFDANQLEILDYNDIEGGMLAVGLKIIIPEAEPLPIIEKKTPVKKTLQPIKKALVETTSELKASNTSEQTTSASRVATTVTENESEEKSSVKSKKESKSETTFTNPIPSGILTQRIHDGNAVDFGASIGTGVVAAAAGSVIVAKSSGYNGGYGLMVVINHANGCQTQYSHLSKIAVAVGDDVERGEKIGASGNSGRSTGPHLHYNERSCGGKNTFAALPLHK